MKWKEIKGYEGFYLISDTGVVKSLDRITQSGVGPYVKKGRIMKTFITKGYERVALTKDKKSKKFMVHRLVAETFIPNLESKKEVNHKDANKLNNSVDNLEWVTKLENMRHAENNKLIKRNKGSQRYNSKLNESLVRRIRERYNNGENFRVLANEIGVNYQTIRHACLGITWRHVK